MTPKLYAIRHGITKANKNGLCLGWADSQITPEAKTKLDYLGKKLAKKRIHKIFCSDLRRTKASLKIINKQIRCNSIFFMKDLRELNWSFFEHKSPKIIKKIRPELYDKNNFFKYNQAIKNGESLLNLERRVKRALKNIKKEKIKGNVLLITHGSVITMLHHIIYNKSYNYYLNKLDLNSYTIFTFNL